MYFGIPASSKQLFRLFSILKLFVAGIIVFKNIYLVEPLEVLVELVLVVLVELKLLVELLVKLVLVESLVKSLEMLKVNIITSLQTKTT